MTLTQIDLDAIEAAIWAHPQGISYLAKIAQMELLLPAWLEAHRGSVGAGADDGISPSYDAYVKRINEQRVADWREQFDGRTQDEATAPDPIGTAQAARLVSEIIAVPSDRLAALAGTRATASTAARQAPASSTEDDEMFAMLAMVFVLTDD